MWALQQYPTHSLPILLAGCPANTPCWVRLPELSCETHGLFPQHQPLKTKPNAVKTTCSSCFHCPARCAAHLGGSHPPDGSSSDVVVPILYLTPLPCSARSSTICDIHSSTPLHLQAPGLLFKECYGNCLKKMQTQVKCFFFMVLSHILQRHWCTFWSHT